MPYTYKKVGDRYCVYKKNGGDKVGCTDGNKPALKKYLAALHMKSNKQKTFETIRKHLAESEQVLKATKPIGLSTFVKNKDAAGAIIGSGLDDQDKQDDIVGGGIAAIAVKDLRPAQTELIPEKAFGMAIDFLQRGKWDGIDLGSIISNDNYIMDGHHRWAAVTLIDPNAKIKATAIDLPGQSLVSTLNAATVGKLGITNGNKGTGNIQEFTSNKLLAVIDNAMTVGIEGKFPLTSDQVKQALEKIPGANGDSQKGKQIMAKNANALSKQIMPLAPPRIEMPVIDGSKVKTIQTMLAKGTFDLRPPFSTSVDPLLPLKESQIIYRQLTLVREWLATGKRIDELKLTSAGIPELLQLVYDRQYLVKKLGYKDFKDFLYWINTDWEQEDHAEAVKALQLLNIPGAQQLIHEIKHFMKTKHRQSLEEELVRRLIRKQVREVAGIKNKKPVNEVLFSIGILLVALPFLIGVTAVFGVVLTYLKNKEKITDKEEAELRSMFTSNKKQAVKQVLDKFGGAKSAATELSKDLDFKKAVEQMPTINEEDQEASDPEQVQDEPGLDSELSELTDLYVKKLKNAQAPVDQSDMIEIVGNVLDSFGYGNQDKLTILQGVKRLTVR